MQTDGIDGILIETHNWGKTVAFWRDLGYEVEFETDHHSGRLRHPRGGPYLFIAERPHDHPSSSCLASQSPMPCSSRRRAPAPLCGRSRNNTSLPYRCYSAIPTGGSLPWAPLPSTK